MPRCSLQLPLASDSRLHAGRAHETGSSPRYHLVGQVVINSAPRRQVMRQQLPGTSTADCVKDAIQDFPAAVYRRSSARFRHRERATSGVPIGVSQISVVRASAGHRCSSAYATNPFQTPSYPQISPKTPSYTATFTHVHRKVTVRARRPKVP